MSKRSERKARIKRMATLKEAARLARHAKRFSHDTRSLMAKELIRRALIRNTIRHYAAKGLQITAAGYEALKGKADAHARNAGLGISPPRII